MKCGQNGCALGFRPIFRVRRYGKLKVDTREESNLTEEKSTRWKIYWNLLMECLNFEKRLR